MDYDNNKVIVHYFKIQPDEEAIVQPVVAEPRSDTTEVPQVNARPYMRLQNEFSKGDITDQIFVF